MSVLSWKTVRNSSSGIHLKMASAHSTLLKLCVCNSGSSRKCSVAIESTMRMSSGFLGVQSKFAHAHRVLETPVAETSCAVAFAYSCATLFNTDDPGLNRKLL